MRARIRPRHLLGLIALTLWFCLVPGLARIANAGTFYVDAAHPNCSPTGPGTEAQPYCTISAAVTLRSAPGNTILVKPGRYREQVDIRASGTAASPIVLRATGPGVIVDGADDFSDVTMWELSGVSIWLAEDVTWQPSQVFVDGARLADSTGTSGPLPAGAFAWESGEGLYVNIGGASPGMRQTLVGRHKYGFNMVTRSWVTIEGFTIEHADTRGIFMQTGCSNLSLLRNTIAFSHLNGIQAVGGSGIVIEQNVVSDNGSHGIALTAGATGCIVRDNESTRNADPVIRVAAGIYVFGAPGNTLERNRVHHNQDSGVHFGTGANDCRSFNNRSWANGDHGYDHLGATGTIHSNDVAHGNHRDGFSIEGGSTGTRLHNCIVVDNGLTTNELDLYVETGSETGFVSDHNLFWNSNAQHPIRYLGVRYTTVAAYAAATGHDTHSIQDDPRFVDPSAGDFHLRIGSPAIDAGHSGAPGWPAGDAAGVTRMDVPNVPNTGQGPIAFADLGALEYPVAAPVARLNVTPTSGTAPLTTSADASATTDPDGGIVSYLFDFGDGTSAGPQPSPVASHTFATAGDRMVTVTVTDVDGMTSTAQQAVAIASSLHAALTVSPATGSTPLGVVADASGSSDSRSTIVSYQFAFGDGTVVGPQASPTATHTYEAGTWQATVTVLNAIGESATAAMDVVVAEVDPGPNLVGNPSWETDTLGWTPEEAMMTRIAGGFVGSWALRVESRAGTASFGIVDAPHWVDSTLAAGTYYRFRAWVRSASAAGTVRLRIRELDGAGQPIGPLVYSHPVTLAPTWRQVAVDYLSRAQGSAIELGIIDSPAAAGEAFEIDHVSIHVIPDGTTGTPPIGGGDFVAPIVFPNPVLDRATLRFALAQAGSLKVEIYDVTGRVVRTLADEAEVLPGQFEYPLDGRDDAGRQTGPGVYFYLVQASGRIATGRFLIVR